MFEDCRPAETAEHKPRLVRLGGELDVGLGNLGAWKASCASVRHNHLNARKFCALLAGHQLRLIIFELRIGEPMTEGICRIRGRGVRPVGREEPLGVAVVELVHHLYLADRGPVQHDRQLPRRGGVAEHRGGPRVACLLAGQEHHRERADLIAERQQHGTGRLHQHCSWPLLRHGHDDVVHRVVQDEGEAVLALAGRRGRQHDGDVGTARRLDCLQDVVAEARDDGHAELFGAPGEALEWRRQVAIAGLAVAGAAAHVVVRTLCAV
mmetsp:Transcript_21514/g.60558  ORF Transcript_21514/g.60558 Transcript_21514/m.60558 type:complete len:266 (+) Transcript_21514:264-1061(+)